MARAPATIPVEEFPEADRLGDFPHPRATERLFGHEGAERALAGAFASERMHHAWLVTGPEGIGKATLAWRLARHVLSPDDERDSQGCSLAVRSDIGAVRQILALSHPGLLLIRRPYDPRNKRFAASIPVDEVRRLRSFLAMAAAPGTWRIVIVDSADDLNVSSANALLKSLEEPPVRTLFVLVSSEPGRLLPTIRSRCRTLELGPVAGAALREAVSAALEAASMTVPDAASWPRLEHLAGGSVRQALALIGSDGLELYGRIESLLARLPKLDWGAVHGLADALSGAANAQRFETFFELLLALLARLVRAKATGEGAADDVSLAQRIIADHRLATWAELWETIVRDKAEVQTLNLDRKALILGTLARLEQAAGA